SEPLTNELRIDVAPRQPVAGRMFGVAIESHYSPARRMYRPLETYRGVVYPWSIDQMGHLNVASYVGRFDEATWHFLANLGLTPGFFKRTGRGAVAAEQRTHYKREVHSGTLLHVTTELRELGRKSIRFVHRMYDSETNEEVASTELVGVFFDTERRESVELPDFVRDHAKALVTAPS
ncbi:MAG: acyl-CoA thioesterase, partial [Gemmatimonadaceae bacterium]